MKLGQKRPGFHLERCRFESINFNFKEKKRLLQKWLNLTHIEVKSRIDKNEAGLYGIIIFFQCLIFVGNTVSFLFKFQNGCT